MELHVRQTATTQGAHIQQVIIYTYVQTYTHTHKIGKTFKLINA